MKRADSHPIELDDVEPYFEQREAEIERLNAELASAIRAKEEAETALAQKTEQFEADRAASDKAIAESLVKVRAADATVREHSTEIAKLMADRVRLIEEKDAANAELQRATNAFEQLKQVENDLRSEIEEANEKFETERARLKQQQESQLIALNDERNADLKEKDAAIAALNDQLTQLAKEHVSVLTGLKDALETTVARIKAAETERDEAKAAVEQANGELAKVRASLAATERELAEARQFREVAQSAMDDHTAHYEAMRAQIEAIRAEIDGHRAMIASYEQKLAELRAVADASLAEQSSVYGALTETLGAMKEHVKAANAAYIEDLAESLTKENEINDLETKLTEAETKSYADEAAHNATIAALKVQLAAATAAAESARGVPERDEPMPSEPADIRNYILRRYQRSAQDARDIIAAARKMRDPLGTLKPPSKEDMSSPPEMRGGGRGALASAAQPIAEFLSRRRVPADVKAAFLGTGFVLLVACYAVVMALVSREWIVSLVSAAMAFIVLYVVAWTLVFLRWGTGGKGGLLLAHFAVLYFVLMFSVRGDTIPEDKKKRMEMLTVRVYTVWLLASLAVAFV